MFSTFTHDGVQEIVEYVETISVGESGEVCDVYRYPGSDEKDLGIIRLPLGRRTPLQKILQGNVTIEGYYSGQGRLLVLRVDGTREIFEYPNEKCSFTVVNIGDYMQWENTGNSDFIAYEICYPPYEDGRYINLEGNLEKLEHI